LNGQFDVMNLSRNEKNILLNQMKSEYIKRIDYMGASSDGSLFSWKNEHLKFTIIKTSKNIHASLLIIPFIVYAEKALSDDLDFHDFTEQSKDYKYDRLDSLENI